MFARGFGIAFTSLVVALSSTARGAADDVTIEQANELFKQGNWSAAIAAYKDIAGRHPEDGAVWTRLGMSLKHLERYDEAVAVLQRADEVGFSPRQVRYQLACVFALQSRKEKAFSSLNRALQAGYSNPRQMESDAGLDNLTLVNILGPLLRMMASTAHCVSESHRDDEIVGGILATLVEQAESIERIFQRWQDTTFPKSAEIRAAFRRGDREAARAIVRDDQHAAEGR